MYGAAKEGLGCVGRRRGDWLHGAAKEVLGCVGQRKEALVECGGKEDAWRCVAAERDLDIRAGGVGLECMG